MMPSHSAPHGRLSLVFALALGAALAVSSPSFAEVRLVERGGGRVDVQVTQVGNDPWTPSGPVDERTLNPSGRLRHDGPPRVGHGSESVIVAWRAPSEAAIRVATGTREGWGATLDIPARGSVSDPHVTEGPDGTLVFWEEREANDSRVHVLFLPEASDETPSRFELDQARLIEVWGDEAGAHLFVLQSPEGAMAPVDWSVDQPPLEPIELEGSVLDDLLLAPVVYSVYRPPMEPIEIARWILGDALQIRFDDLLLAGRTDLRGERRGESLLYWWVEADRLNAIRFGAGGPEWPAIVLVDPRSRLKSSRALLNEAIRELSN